MGITYDMQEDIKYYIKQGITIFAEIIISIIISIPFLSQFMKIKICVMKILSEKLERTTFVPRAWSFIRKEENFLWEWERKITERYAIFIPYLFHNIPQLTPSSVQSFFIIESHHPRNSISSRTCSTKLSPVKFSLKFNKSVKRPWIDQQPSRFRLLEWNVERLPADITTPRGDRWKREINNKPTGWNVGMSIDGWEDRRRLW